MNTQSCLLRWCVLYRHMLIWNLNYSRMYIFESCLRYHLHFIFTDYEATQRNNLYTTTQFFCLVGPADFFIVFSVKMFFFSINFLIFYTLNVFIDTFKHLCFYCLSDLTSVPGILPLQISLCISAWSDNCMEFVCTASSFSFIPLKYEAVTLFIWLNVVDGHPLVLGFVWWCMMKLSQYSFSDILKHWFIYFFMVKSQLNCYQLDLMWTYARFLECTEEFFILA